MKAALHHVHDESSTIRSFFFRPERPLRFVAGQFIEVSLPHTGADERGTKRWFTLSSAPGHELICITTKLADRPSSFKHKLWGLKPGDEVDISEAMGDFVLPKDAGQPLVWIAGGVGITPFHSIVQWLIDTGQSRHIQFLYSVHDKDDLVFSQTWNQPYIDAQYFIDQPNLTAQKIVELTGGIDGKQLFISGPEPMTEAIVEQFKNVYGLQQDQLITDYFPGYSAI